MSEANKNLILDDWINSERAAEAMIPIIGQLYRERSVEISVFGQLLVKRTVNDILKAHDAVHHIEDYDLTPVETGRIVQQISEMPVEFAHIDIGKLYVKYRGVSDDKTTEEFLNEELASAFPGESDDPQRKPQKDVVLYGFGRIGRLLARMLCHRPDRGRVMRLRAIVVRKGKGDDLSKRASLLRMDSVHGPFEGIVATDHENSTLIINGQRVRVIYANDPSEVDYTRYGIENAVVVDNTGVWRDEAGLSQHTNANGATHALLTAPGKGDIKNVVHGLNHDMITDDDTILSAASCTTNAIAPVIKAINDKFGVIDGHMETVHAYTNDQNLIDNYHKGDRRGRSAPLNMVLTETGAATAVAKALPEMAGKLTGSSVRVPTPNVSMAILSFNLETEATTDEINDHMRYMAFHSDLQKQIGYSNAPDAVSTDFVGSRAAGVFDALATKTAGKRCVLYVWYDNEYGYTAQVVRILRQVTNSTLPAYPVEA